MDGESPPLGRSGSGFDEMPIGYGEGAAKINLKARSNRSLKNPYKAFRFNPETPEMYLIIFLPNFPDSALKTLAQKSPFVSERGVSDDDEYRPMVAKSIKVQKYIIR